MFLTELFAWKCFVFGTVLEVVFKHVLICPPPPPFWGVIHVIKSFCRQQKMNISLGLLIML
jgi:hypothetical protein